MANDQFGNPDLMTALAAFTQGMKSLSLQRTLTAANDQVQQIKASELDESKKRQALQGLANQMVLRMSGMGADASQVEQAFRAVAPPALPTSADAAIVQGTLTGDKSLLEAGQKAQDALTADNLKLMKAKSDIDANAQARLFAQQEKLLGMKSAMAKHQQLKQADTDFAVNVSSAMNNLNTLEKTVKKYGNMESGLGLAIASNKKASATLTQLYYDTAIAYAKIVDPNSVAREGEVAAAQKYTVPAGWLTDNDTTLAAIEKLKQGIKARAKERAKIRQAGGLDVWDQQYLQSQMPGASGTAQEDPNAKPDVF